MPQPDYRAQLGEALLQLVDMQAEFEEYKISAAGVPNIEIDNENLIKCRESNEALTSRFKECNETIVNQDKEIAELGAIKIAQSGVIKNLQKEFSELQKMRQAVIGEAEEAKKQIKFLQAQIKKQG